MSSLVVSIGVFALLMVYTMPTAQGMVPTVPTVSQTSKTLSYSIVADHVLSRIAVRYMI